MGTPDTPQVRYLVDIAQNHKTDYKKDQHRIN